MDTNYKVIKLKTGDSIISEVNETTDNMITLHRPMVFKVVTMLNDNMVQKDVLLFRNWAEFTSDETISISKDIIASSWNPNEVILNCYELEKFKQDMPEVYKMLKKDDPELPPMGNPVIPAPSAMPNIPKPNGIPNGMANFNLTLPMDVAKGLIEYLEENGVSLQGPDINNIDDFNDLMNEALQDKDFDDDEPFGNHPDDWSPDPNDYLR